MDKRKIIFVVILVVLMGSAMLVPKFLSSKEKADDEESDLPSVLPKTRQQESLSFEKEIARNRSFEELTPEEKAQLYAQTQEFAQEAAQIAVEEIMREQRVNAARQQQQTSVLPSANSMQQISVANIKL